MAGLLAQVNFNFFQSNSPMLKQVAHFSIKKVWFALREKRTEI